MGDKGKKDKSRREGQKKSKLTLKEKRKRKKEKNGVVETSLQLPALGGLAEGGAAHGALGG